MMDHFEFHRDNYLKELQRKHDLGSSIALPVGIVSVIGGAIFLFLKDIKGFSYDLIFSCLAIFLAVSVVSLITAVVFLILSDYNFGYIYVPTSSEVKKYYDDLVEYYEGNSEKADPEFIEFLSGEYAANAHTNSINNDSKSAYLHRAKSFIITALVFLLLSSPFYLVKFYKLKQTQKTEITNLQARLGKLEAVMNSNYQDNPRPQANPPPQSNPPPPQKPKPEPPKSRVLKESQQPPKSPPPSKEN